MTRCTYCGGDDHGPNQCSDQPPTAPVETEVRCYGCGSPMTASDLAKLKAEDPKVISCCPERKPLNIDDWMTRALEAERKLAAHSQPPAAPVETEAGIIADFCRL